MCEPQYENEELCYTHLSLTILLLLGGSNLLPACSHLVQDLLIVLSVLFSLPFTLCLYMRHSAPVTCKIKPLTCL